jgi:hypothetical protein
MVDAQIKTAFKYIRFSFANMAPSVEYADFLPAKKSIDTLGLDKRVAKGIRNRVFVQDA